MNKIKNYFIRLWEESKIIQTTLLISGILSVFITLGAADYTYIELTIKEVHRQTNRCWNLQKEDHYLKESWPIILASSDFDKMSLKQKEHLAINKFHELWSLLDLTPKSNPYKDRKDELQKWFLKSAGDYKKYQIKEIENFYAPEEVIRYRDLAYSGFPKIGRLEILITKITSASFQDFLKESLGIVSFISGCFLLSFIFCFTLIACVQLFLSSEIKLFNKFGLLGFIALVVFITRIGTTLSAPVGYVNMTEFSQGVSDPINIFKLLPTETLELRGSWNLVSGESFIKQKANIATLICDKHQERCEEILYFIECNFLCNLHALSKYYQVKKWTSDIIAFEGMFLNSQYPSLSSWNDCHSVTTEINLREATVTKQIKPIMPISKYCKEQGIRNDSFELSDESFQSF